MSERYAVLTWTRSAAPHHTQWSHRFQRRTLVGSPRRWLVRVGSSMHAQSRRSAARVIFTAPQVFGSLASFIALLRCMISSDTESGLPPQPAPQNGIPRIAGQRLHQQAFRIALRTDSYSSHRFHSLSPHLTKPDCKLLERRLTHQSTGQIGL